MGIFIDIIGSRSHRQSRKLNFGPKGGKTGENWGNKVAKQPSVAYGVYATPSLGVG